MNQLKNFLIILAILFFIVAGIALYQLWESILWAAQIALIAFLLVGSVLLFSIAIVLALRIWDWLDDMFANSRHDRSLKEIELQLKQAEADQAAVQVVIAKIDEQVHIRDGGRWRPAHFESRTYANGPASYMPPLPGEAAAWEMWQNTHGRRQAEPLALPDSTSEIAPPPLLPKLLTAQRVIIAGGSDAGKTTLAKHIIAGRLDDSQVIIIDPHAPSKILGVDCIGAGRDYGAIEGALLSLCELMSHRYDDVKYGLAGYGEHDRISVFVDEWTGIRKNVKNAGELLGTLLVESRKVNIHLTFLTHSLTVDVLGIDAQIRASAKLVQLYGGEDEEYRAFILPRTKIEPDGKKSLPVEYALPGLFVGYAQPQAEVVKALPDVRVLRAQRMKAEGASVTAITKVFYNVQRPNGGQIKAVRELLRRAAEERNGRVGEAVVER